jgi:hypothetical protein
VAQLRRRIDERRDGEIGVGIDEADTRGAVDQDALAGPTEAAADAAEKADVLGDVRVAFDAVKNVRALQVVAKMHPRQ